MPLRQRSWFGPLVRTAASLVLAGAFARPAAPCDAHENTASAKATASRAAVLETAKREYTTAALRSPAKRTGQRAAARSRSAATPSSQPAPARVTAVAGMRIAIDPETGRPVMPSAEQPDGFKSWARPCTTSSSPI